MNFKVREIPEHPNYFCDENGIVYSKKTGTQRKLKTRIGGRGYEIACIYVENKARYKLVHSLILITWGTPRPSGMTCNHKNGIKTDNRIENLEWLSQGDNERHSRSVLKKDCKGEKHKCSKLTSKDVKKIRALKTAGWTYSRLAKTFPVGMSQLCRIVKYDKWKHV